MTSVINESKAVDHRGRVVLARHLEGGGLSVTTEGGPVVLGPAAALRWIAELAALYSAPSAQALLEELRQRDDWPEVPF